MLEEVRKSFGEFMGIAYKELNTRINPGIRSNGRYMPNDIKN